MTRLGTTTSFLRVSARHNAAAVTIELLTLRCPGFAIFRIKKLVEGLSVHDGFFFCLIHFLSLKYSFINF